MTKLQATKTMSWLIAILALPLLLVSCTGSRTTITEQGESLRDIAHDAFIYAYPLLEQMKTINGMREFMGVGFNEPAMNPKLPWDNVGQPIVAPNLTSMTGGVLIDLSRGPVTLEIPEVQDRYIVYQCIDVFTHNFFYLGS